MTERQNDWTVRNGWRGKIIRVSADKKVNTTSSHSVAGVENTPCFGKVFSEFINVATIIEEVVDSI